MIDVKDLEGFLAILDEGSISKAADKLGITQPALSLKLKKIETELGLQLFQRTSRSMVPLETCWAIEPAAREILIKLEGVKETLATRISDLKGTVRFGCLTGWIDALMIPLIKLLRSEAPTIKLNLQVGQTSELLRAVSAGQLDLVVIAKPFSQVEGVTCKHLFDERLMLISNGLPDHDDTATFKANLLSMQWVTMTVPDPLTNQYWREMFAEDFPWNTIKTPLSIDHIFAIRSLVANIPGTVAVVPSQVITFGPSNEVPVGSFQTHLSVPQKNGLFIAWREHGLELKRFQYVHDLTLRIADEIKRKLNSKKHGMDKET